MTAEIFIKKYDEKKDFSYKELEDCFENFKVIDEKLPKDLPCVNFYKKYFQINNRFFMIESDRGTFQSSKITYEQPVEVEPFGQPVQKIEYIWRIK